MTTRRYYWQLLFIVLGLLSFQPLCLGQDKGGKKPDKIISDNTTKVTIDHKTGITTLEIDLQNAPNNMEPVAEPRRIRIDDRANVQFLLRNLSPLDVCSRTSGTPTVNAETNVAESMAATIAKLGGLAIGTSTATLPANSMKSMFLSTQMKTTLAELSAVRAAPECKVQADPEYTKILAFSQEFFAKASGLIGRATRDGKCRNDRTDQVELACEIDSATRQLANYAGDDYRGTRQTNFKIEGNPQLQGVRDSYTLSLNSIDDAGKLQAMVDEMTTWAQDLHKKYDYTVPATVQAADNSSPTPPPAIAGALTVSPTTLSFTPATLTQVVQLAAGGQPGTFTATPSPDTGWLLFSKPGAPPSTGTFTGTAPDHGTFDLHVTVNPKGLDATTHYGYFTILGTGSAMGTTIVNVTFKPVSTGPSGCDLDLLNGVDVIVDRAKAEMSLLSDNNKTLEGAQATLKAAYMALVKVEDDFKRRQDQKIVHPDGDGVLVQEFNLGTDRKVTSPGYISCVSDIDGKTPTTTNINYSLLYQDVPHWSASAGLLTSFQEKKIIGVANEITPGVSPPKNMQVFQVTDRAQFQLIPMAYVNYRIVPYKSSHYGKGKEDELVWTTHLSAGFGINPNTGTNQPEFFLGLAVGMNHFMFHPGIHIGRTESLGGGYSLNTPVPAGVTTAPIIWSYHLAFSIGFSVRVAPY
jgi:hypothetical protein